MIYYDTKNNLTLQKTMKMLKLLDQSIDSDIWNVNEF